MKIWKYTLPTGIGFGTFDMELPKNAKILTVQLQDMQPQIWVLVNPEEKQTEKRTFKVSGTGNMEIRKNEEYIGTYQNPTFVYHLFERKEKMNIEVPDGKCPKCGTVIEDYGCQELQDMTVYYPFTCHKCSFEGREWYDLTFTGFTDSSGNEIGGSEKDAER